MWGHVGRDRFSAENLDRGFKKIENHCRRRFATVRNINIYIYINVGRLTVADERSVTFNKK